MSFHNGLSLEQYYTIKQVRVCGRNCALYSFFNLYLPPSPLPQGLLQTMSGFCLGTVQFGLVYGITNSTGLLPEEDVHGLIKKAVGLGVTCLDTARAYGLAEERLGRILSCDDEKLRSSVSVVTKLHPLDWVSEHMNSPDVVSAAVDSSVFRSCRELQTSKLDVLCLHRASQINTPVWDRLVELREEGVISKLGVSVQNVEEAVTALQNKDVKHIQIPLNLLDWRWRTKEFMQVIGDRTDVTVHCRSCVLQGILLSGPEKWPKTKESVDVEKMCAILDKLVVETGAGSRLKLCYLFVQSLPFVDAIVGGVDNEEQLVQNLGIFNDSKFTDAQRLMVENAFPVGSVPVALLDPSQWIRKKGKR